MSSRPLSPARLPQLSRRSFVQAAGAGLFVLGVPRSASRAQSQTQTVLTGTHFDLQIGEAPFNFTGNKRIGTVVNGQIPAPLLRWREGETITLRGARDIAAFAVDSEDAHRAFVAALFHHMVKQSIDAYGAATLTHLRETFEEDSYNIANLLARIARVASQAGAANAPGQVSTTTPNDPPS